eukprot:scaffold295096_cov32-Tisochrysis_lutea.AAC.2
MRIVSPGCRTERRFTAAWLNLSVACCIHLGNAWSDAAVAALATTSAAPVVAAAGAPDAVSATLSGRASVLKSPGAQARDSHAALLCSAESV